MLVPLSCLFGALLASFALDLGTKAWALQRPTRSPGNGWIAIELVHNRGHWLGHWRGWWRGRRVDPRVLVPLYLAALAAALAALFTGLLQGPLAAAGLGCALGGAAGNLFDWMRRGAVVDFLRLRGWFTFNLADVCIDLGLACVLLAWLLERAA